MNTMKAYAINDVKGHGIANMPIPTPRSSQVLIKVMAVGLCGTDAHIYKGEYFGKYPIVPGHEFAGIIEAVGDGVTAFSPGDRVSADPNIFCDNCPACKANRQNFCNHLEVAGVTTNGAMAQYMAISEKCVFHIDDIPFTHGALIEPLACVVHGQNMLAPKLGSRTLVIGAGPIGLMHMQIGRQNGFVAVCDVKNENLETAKRLGADAVLLSADVADFIAANGRFDVVIDCTGVPAAIEAALPWVEDMGTLLIFGVCPSDSRITVNPYEVFRRELRIIGSFALRKTFAQAMRLAANSRLNLDALVGAKITLDEMPQYMENFTKGKTTLKTIMYPNGLC